MEKYCKHCGAKMVEYKHTLSTGICGSLVKLYKKGKGCHKLDNLGLTHSQNCNFQKLKYWDLVEKRKDFDGRGGVWKITERGIRFARCALTIPKNVWTFRDTRIRYEGGDVLIDAVCDGYKYKPQYAYEAVAHEGNGQTSFFNNNAVKAIKGDK